MRRCLHKLMSVDIDFDVQNISELIKHSLTVLLRTTLLTLVAFFGYISFLPNNNFTISRCLPLTAKCKGVSPF